MKLHGSFLIGPIALVVLASGTGLSQTQWLKYSGNPVIGATAIAGVYGTFDEQAVVQPFVMEDQGVLRMWYMGMDAGMRRSAGEAISPDGVHWYASRGGAALSPGPAGSFDELGINKPCVIRDDDGYKMYYSSGPDYHHKVGLAVSQDGYTWTKYTGNPVLDWGAAGEWDAAGVWAPMVIFENHAYRMWYQGYDGTFSSIGYATSTDGINWTKYSGNPVLLHGAAGEFDYYTAGEPNVLRADGRYHMFYTSTDATIHNNVGYAVSQDGIIWTKYDHNPVLPPGPSAWDGSNTAAASVIFSRNQFRMWYSGWAGGQSVNVGYATAPLERPPVRYKGNLISGAIPSKVEVAGNYPNPFNPQTEIQFGVPGDGRARLVVYDVLGKAVKTLVDEQVSQGWHAVTWDGTNAAGEQVATGTYYYRVEYISGGAISLTEIKGMTYIK